MESQLKTCSGHGGFLLITVLILTAVGLLFGAGALLLFRYQCQMRIDRQHEFEKIYAVRSALNYIRTGQVPVLGKSLEYHTASERNLRIHIKPVAPIFPVPSNDHHFMMESKDSSRNFQPSSCINQYDENLDYEYGANGVSTPDSPKIESWHSGRDEHGLVFTDTTETNKTAKWWVNIGMSGTGGWLQEEYGRRYCFTPRSFVGYGTTSATCDVMRLCIIREVEKPSGNGKPGSKYGWPLSKNGERALVFEIWPVPGGGEDNNAIISLSEYGYQGGVYIVTNHLYQANCPSTCQMGIQLADNKMSVFYIRNDKLNIITDPASLGYTFLPAQDVFVMTPETYKYFKEGVYTDIHGVHAPDLRAVFEVEARSSERKGQASAETDFLTNFRVTPAWQFDVFLEYPTSMTNLATIAQRIGTYERDSGGYAIRTYDTHGTENKGFRKDEREWERKRNGW